MTLPAGRSSDTPLKLKKLVVMGGIMAQIVCVHGIAQQLKGPETLAVEWRTALRDGMRLAGANPHQLPPEESVQVAFYGDLFRGREKGDSPFRLADIEEGVEADLVIAWAAAAGLDQPYADQNRAEEKSGWAPRSIQRSAEALLRVPFFARLTERSFVGALKQVQWYLTEPSTREAVRERVSRLLSSDTRLVIGHSLGSVVAYEVLCRTTLTSAPSFITLGSPIGLPKLVFDRLDPAPVNGQGSWPSATSWTNIADIHDIVACVKNLSPLFGGRIEDIEVNNEALAHDIGPYFTARETGEAVLKALRAS